jgi:large conductance mechanosensitive channel
LSHYEHYNGRLIARSRKEAHILEQFKEFALEGNVIDLAVGLIIGAAFGRIVTSLLNDVLMPPIGLLLGSVDFSNLFLDLSRAGYDTLAQAQEAGAATLNFGLFLNTVIEFVIVALAMLLLIRQVNRLRQPAAAEAPVTRACPYCHTQIPIAATRCPNCTSQLSGLA